MMGGSLEGTNGATDDLDDLDFEKEDTAPSIPKREQSIMQVSATLLLGDRPVKDKLELFIQNLLTGLREKGAPLEGLVATVSLKKLSSPWLKANPQFSMRDTISLLRDLQ